MHHSTGTQNLHSHAKLTIDLFSLFEVKLQCLSFFSDLDKGAGCREDSPLYSPVSYDSDAVSSESDYDDIGNYIQQADHLH